MTLETAKVLVDTSVFVNFFRGRQEPKFEALLNNNQILLSQFVKLELLQGVKKSEIKLLEDVLGGLEVIDVLPSLLMDAEMLLKKIKSVGLFLGVVDLLIAAEVNLLGVNIFSHDKVFSKLFALKLIPGVFV